MTDPTNTQGRKLPTPFWPFASPDEHHDYQESLRKAYAMLAACHTTWMAAHDARLAENKA